MIKNSVYLSSPMIYAASIYGIDGVEQYTKKFDQFQNAFDWCKGMSSNGESFKITDIDTKKVLKEGSFKGDEFIENPEKSDFQKGIVVELEHKDLIEKMLREAGRPVTKSAILSIAAEIARVHEKEDPNYYAKLEKTGLA